MNCNQLSNMLISTSQLVMRSLGLGFRVYGLGLDFRVSDLL